jgi:hypothetical protein
MEIPLDLKARPPYGVDAENEAAAPLTGSEGQEKPSGADFQPE